MVLVRPRLVRVAVPQHYEFLSEFASLEIQMPRLSEATAGQSTKEEKSRRNEHAFDVNEIRSPDLESGLLSGIQEVLHFNKVLLYVCSAQS